MKCRGILWSVLGLIWLFDLGLLRVVLGWLKVQLLRIEKDIVAIAGAEQSWSLGSKASSLILSKLISVNLCRDPSKLFMMFWVSFQL